MEQPNNTIPPMEQAPKKRKVALKERKVQIAVLSKQRQMQHRPLMKIPQRRNTPNKALQGVIFHLPLQLYSKAIKTP